MNWAIVVAGGQGARMGLPYNKAFLHLGGISLLAHSCRAMLQSPHVQGLVLVTSPEDRDRALGELQGLLEGGKPLRWAPGGATRRASVQSGLALVPEDCELVLVHDAARPLVSQEVIGAAVRGAREAGCAAPSIPVVDTIKQAREGLVLGTPDRSALMAVQTPQVFRRGLLLRAHALGAERFPDATDDTLLVEMLGEPVLLTQGDPGNLKITTPQDLRIAQALLLGEEEEDGMRIGTGYDVHRLVEGRALILLGESIPFEKGLLGHSDADVAAHALSDALLGAAGLGDIGRHFPDTQEAYRGADSMELLAQVVGKVAQAGYRPGNVDVTIVAQRPKLAGFLPAMRIRTARVLGIPEERVNIKATTTEGLGFEGEGLGISAQAVAGLERTP